MHGVRLRRNVVTAFPAEGPAMLSTLRAGATPRMVRRSTPRIGVRRPEDYDRDVTVATAGRDHDAMPGTAPAPTSTSSSGDCGCG